MGCVETGLFQPGQFVMCGGLQFKLKKMHCFIACMKLNQRAAGRYSHGRPSHLCDARPQQIENKGARLRPEDAHFSNLIAEDGIVRRDATC
jgi:hypothetical protein